LPVEQQEIESRPSSREPAGDAEHEGSVAAADFEQRPRRGVAGHGTERGAHGRGLHHHPVEAKKVAP
jgi:hypothetical protein